jgi:hypothetical protein
MWTGRSRRRDLIDNQKTRCADPFRGLSRPHSKAVALFDDRVSRRGRGFHRVVVFVALIVLIVGAKPSLEDRVEVLLGVIFIIKVDLLAIELVGKLIVIIDRVFVYLVEVDILSFTVLGTQLAGIEIVVWTLDKAGR